MRLWEALQGLSQPFHTAGEIAEVLNLPLPSVRVLLSRKVKAGELMRVRRDLYLLPEKFQAFGEKELFQLSNFIQTPSAISFLSALSYYGLSTQVSQSVVVAANPIRTRIYTAGPVSFQYIFVRPDFYFGFERKHGFFIAEPEKALLDSIYLLSLGRYALDDSALNLAMVDWKKLEKWLKKYPAHVRKFYLKWRKNHERHGTS